MEIRNWVRIAALMLLVSLVFAVTACGGGSDDTTGTIDNTITGSGTDADPIETDINVYPGKDDGSNDLNTDTEPDEISETPFRFGDNIFEVPLDTNGTGRVVCSEFTAGQRIAFVVVNLNPTYLDAHLIPGSGFPLLPESSFTVHGDLVEKSATMARPVSSIESLGLGGSNGLAASSEVLDAGAIYEREAVAQGLTPYASVPPTKTTSSIQKGELRWFTNVRPRPSWPPREVPPNPEEPEQDTSDFEWPVGYNCQSGRLVAIGAHCLVFLTTDINNGHPDTIQFTEARLNRLAREFDNTIYPTATAAFGPVQSYRDNGIMDGIDRDLEITGADYNGTEYAGDAPGWFDYDISQEEKVIIFLMNAAAGGFFVGASQTSETEYGDPYAVGSTIYIGTDNFPANDNAWEEAYSVMAHEFQHKLYNDHGLPSRPITGAGGNYNWLNEGLSQLDIHLCGYTVNSGKIIPWAIDGQLTSYLDSVNQSAVCMDGNGQFPYAQQTQYGNGFLFFLYLYEHYDAGVGKRIYDLAKTGETDYITLIEEGAQYTIATGPGNDGAYGTADDAMTTYNDTFDQIYTKFIIANFIDGIYKDEYSDLFDSRFHYNTIDLRGTINLTSGTITLPGVRTDVFPDTGGYPVEDIDRPVIPWGCDYFVFSNGDGRDLEVTLYSDSNFKFFMLPCSYNPNTLKVEITPGVVVDY